MQIEDTGDTTGRFGERRPLSKKCQRGFSWNFEIYRRYPNLSLIAIILVGGRSDGAFLGEWVVFLAIMATAIIAYLSYPTFRNHSTSCAIVGGGAHPWVVPMGIVISTFFALNICYPTFGAHYPLAWAIAKVVLAPLTLGSLFIFVLDGLGIGYYYSRVYRVGTSFFLANTLMEIYCHYHSIGSLNSALINPNGFALPVFISRLFVRVGLVKDVRGLRISDAVE